MTTAQAPHSTDKAPHSIKLLFILIPVGIVLFAALFVIIGFLRSGGEMPPMPQKVVLAKAVKKSLVPYYEHVALVEAEKEVELRARVNGFLTDKPFQEGDFVKKDSILFQIEPDQYQALFAAAEAEELSAQSQLDRAALDFNRQKDLYEKRSTPKADYDAAKASYDVARAGVLAASAKKKQAQLNLDYATINAPFDGQVSDTPYSVGSLLGPESGALATIVSLDPITVSFGISDKILVKERSRLGDDMFQAAQWQVRLKLGPDNFYPELGSLTYMAPLVDRKTDTVKFKAIFKNDKHVLLPGQVLMAILEPVSPLTKVILPKGVLITSEKGRYVLVPKTVPAHKDEKSGQDIPEMTVSEIRWLTLGEELDEGYVVLDGLKEGEQFIAQGLMANGATLREGAPIQIVNPEDAIKAQQEATKKSVEE